MSTQSVNHSAGEYVRGDTTTNGIESVWALLKRALHGTWHSVSPEHLSRHLNETAFRLNEGALDVPTLRAMNVLATACFGRRLTYDDFIGGSDKGVMKRQTPRPQRASKQLTPEEMHNTLSVFDVGED